MLPVRFNPPAAKYIKKLKDKKLKNFIRKQLIRFVKIIQLEN